MSARTVTALDSPLRHPWVAVALVLLTISTLLLCVSLLAGNDSLPGTAQVFGIALLLAALVSTPAFISLAYLNRREREPAIALFGVLAWGCIGATAVSAVLAGFASVPIINAFGATPGVQDAIASGLGMAELLNLLDWLPTVFVSPTVEESVKLLGVIGAMWLLRGRIRGMRDGLMLGALVGLGFGIVETAVYVVHGWNGEGTPPYAYELATRYALLGFTGHGLWTALAGAGIGLARTLDRIEARVAAVLAGFLAAVLAHALHNGLGGAVMVEMAARLGASPGETTSLFVVWASAALTWAFIEGGFVILMILCLISSGFWERDTIVKGLEAEASDVVTADELAAARAETVWRIRRLDGMRRQASKSLVRAQNSLALRRWSAERIGLDPSIEPGMQALRAEIAEIRGQDHTVAPTPT